MNRIAEGHPGPPSGFSSPRHRSRSRNPSFSSDRPSTSTISHALMMPPVSISPEAAFIAASAASQIVTNDHDGHADTWYDQQGLEPSPMPPTVSPMALQLVNNFLDQLLFNVLQLSRSTSLSALRPAVTEVLKPKLAKDAIDQADEELREYLGGDDDNEDGEEANTALGDVARRDWDLELAWKRTRLRCMVYSSLGDMEEGEEDFYTEEGNLGDDSDQRLDDDAIVSPAVAIFLTSILEFMGEQALIVAGQAACYRLRTRLEKELRDSTKLPGDVADAIVVEELDMERVALDRTLGRLWRAWKKRMRGPNESVAHRSFSRESLRRRPSNGGDHTPSRTRQRSIDAEAESIISVRLADEKPEATPTSTRSSPSSPLYRPVSNPAACLVSARSSSNTMDAARIDSSIGAVGPTKRSSSSSSERDTAQHQQQPFAPADTENVKPKSRKKAARPRSLLIFPRVPTDIPVSSPMRPLTAGSRARRRSDPMPPVAAAQEETSSTAPSVSAETRSEPPKSKSRKRRSNRYSSRSSRSMVTQDEGASIVSEADIAEDLDATPQQAPLKSRRISKLITSVSMVSSAIANATTTATATATATVAPVAAPPSTPGRFLLRTSESSDDAVDLTDEPQILVTERVSLRDRSASPATSDSGRVARTMHRSSSVHSVSARIVDVTPRSPALMRTSSLDPLERVRPINMQTSRSTPTSPLSEDYRHAVDSICPLIGPGSRSPAWPPSQSLAEVEEEEHPVVSHDDSKQAATMTNAMADAMADAKDNAPTCRPISVEPVDQAARSIEDTCKSSLDVGEPNDGKCDELHDGQRDDGEAAISRTVTPEPRSQPYSPRKKAYHQQKPQEQLQLQQLKLQEEQQRHQRRRQQEQRQQQQQQSSSASSRPRPLVSLPEDQPPAVSTKDKSTAPSPTILLPVAERANSQAPRREPSSTQKPQGSATSDASSSYRADSPVSVTSSVMTDRLRAGTVRSADDSASTRSARNFEELIQSDETLQYTLTPENMRDNDAERSLRGESSVISLKRRRSEDSKFNRSRSRSNPGPNESRSTTSLNRSGSVSRNTGLNSHPVITIPPMPSQNKRLGQAREARTPNDSVAEMASFFRSTGPNGVAEQTAVQPASHRAQGSAASSPLQPNSPAQPNSPHAQGATASGRTSAASSSRTRLQARDAAVEKREDNSDLIDFIRRGPPAATTGNHRIPRTIAPFRTTMDSDQMAGAVGGKAVDATLPDMRASLTTQMTNATDLSMPSSVNSNTALLKKPTSPPTSSTPSSMPRRNEHTFFDDIEDTHMDGMPKRKQRRVLDQYALDSDDDDDDDDEAGEEDDELDDLYHSVAHTRRKPAVKEESLAEFLSSCEPPPPPPQAVEPAPAKPKRKNSAAGIMGRFTRSGSSSKDAAAKAPAAATYESRSLNSRTGPTPAARGHIPLQVAMPPGYDAYGPVGDRPTTQGSKPTPSEPVSAHSARAPPHSAGRVNMRKFEAREPSSSNMGRTNDLAAFLRDSEPPPDMSFTAMVTAQPQQQQTDSSGGFSRMFSRRKKSLAT